MIPVQRIQRILIFAFVLPEATTLVATYIICFRRFLFWNLISDLLSYLPQLNPSSSIP